MPIVLNKRTCNYGDGVYVGRPSKFGNPFPMANEGQRAAVCKQFEEWVMTQPQLLLDIKKELKSKDLICYCAPKSCHADTLLRIANE